MEPEELEETQSYMRGVFPYTVQTIGDLAKRLETLTLFGFPDDYYMRYLERLATVTREEILRDGARGTSIPTRIVVVAVGPAEVLEPQLEGAGAGDRLVAGGAHSDLTLACRLRRGGCPASGRRRREVAIAGEGFAPSPVA